MISIKNTQPFISLVVQPIFYESLSNLTEIQIIFRNTLLVDLDSLSKDISKMNLHISAQ